MNEHWFSSKSNEWTTPQALFDSLNREFHFTLDPCAAEGMQKCEQSFSIRAGKEIDVTGWHIKELNLLGFNLIEHHKVETPRQRTGANANLRVNYESVLIFKSGTNKCT